MQFLANLTGIHQKLAPGAKDNDNSRYRCVEVHPEGPDCCEAALHISGKRFLRKEIPTLPLDGCDAFECQCRYKLLDDRRSGPRRKSDITGDGDGHHFASEARHRTSTGRRHSD